MEAARAEVQPGQQPVEALTGIVCRVREESDRLLIQVTSLANIQANMDRLPRHIRSALETDSEVMKDW